MRIVISTPLGTKVDSIQAGGAGSGHHGHAGVKGKRGGSAPTGSGSLAGRFNAGTRQTVYIQRSDKTYSGRQWVTPELMPGQIFHRKVGKRSVTVNASNTIYRARRVTQGSTLIVQNEFDMLQAALDWGDEWVEGKK